MWKKKNIFSFSVNAEANIRVGKDFLMKLPFHSEIAEEEEYFSSSVNAEANIRLGTDSLMKLPFHSEIVEEEEYIFLLYN